MGLGLWDVTSGFVGVGVLGQGRQGGQICPAAAHDGFRYGHPGCSYSNGVVVQATENDAFLVGQVGRGSSATLIFPPKTQLLFHANFSHFRTQNPCDMHFHGGVGEFGF